VLGALRRSGLADAEVALYYRVLGDAVLSYSAMDAAPQALDPDVRATDLRAWKVEYQSQDPAHYPHLAAYSHLFPALDDPANYATLIELLLDAVESARGGRGRPRAAGAAGRTGSRVHAIARLTRTSRPNDERPAVNPNTVDQYAAGPERDDPADLGAPATGLRGALGPPGR